MNKYEISGESLKLNGFSALSITALFRKSGIYEIVCIKNGKRYIGSAAGRHGFVGRWQSHIDELEKKSHRNILLQRSWDKYGKENFMFKILEFAPKIFCIKREQWWMDLYGSYLVENGYNLNSTAGSNLGRKLSSEQIEKMRLRVTGTIHSDATKKKRAISMNKVFLEKSILPTMKIQKAIKTAEEQNLIIDIVTISNITGYSKPTVIKYLELLGIKLKDDYRRKLYNKILSQEKKLDNVEEKIQTAIETAEKQKLIINIKTIAELSGLSRPTITKYLKLLNIVLKDKPCRSISEQLKIKIKIQTAIETAEKQKLIINIKTIAELSGLSRQMTATYLDKMDVELRDKRRQVNIRIA